MNEALREAFRHNAWAAKYLLDFCRDLTEEQLGSATTGTYGNLLATFDHTIRADAAYLRRLSGSGPDWIDSDETADLARLRSWVEESEQRWDEFLSQPVDAERVLQVDDGAYEVRAGVIVAQALHHGNHHREQICAILTSLGFEPPDVQAWEYAWKTGRIWDRVAGD